MIWMMACSRSGGSGRGQWSPSEEPGEAFGPRIAERRWILFTGTIECLLIQERPNSLAINYRLETCLRGVFLETLEEEYLPPAMDGRSGQDAPRVGIHARRRRRILDWQRSAPRVHIDPKTLHNYGSLGWTYGESPWKSRLALSERTCVLDRDALPEVEPQAFIVFEKECELMVKRLRDLLDLESTGQDLARACIESPPFPLDEVRLRELRWNLEMESYPLRGGGLPDALGAPLYDDDVEVDPFPNTIVAKTVPVPPDLMDLRIDNVKIRKGSVREEDVRKTLRTQRRQLMHRYQQKYPWAFPAAGQRKADRTGPEGWIQFLLTIDSEGRATSCRSREPEDLLGLGDRACSVMVNWRFPAPKRGHADLRFEIGFFKDRRTCIPE